MNNDLVSLLIPVYNREDILAETIASAQAQTYSNIEIVITDNCSTDGSWELIQKFAQSDPRIVSFRSETNLGPVRNWLKCVELAKGKYAKILWSDDLIAPDFIGQTLPLLGQDTGFVFTATRIFSQDPTIGDLVYQVGATGHYPSEQYIVGDLEDRGYPVSPGCAIFRMQDMKQNLKLHVPNQIDSDFSMHAIGNDLLIFLLTAKDYKNFGFIEQPLSFFRAHQGSISTASNTGKLPTHYNMVRAHFCESHRPDLIRRLNTKLLINILRYPYAKQSGLNAISRFYCQNQNFRISKTALSSWFLSKLATRLTRLFPKFRT